MSDCIIWPGRVDKDGYGVTQVDGHTRAHRLIYSLFVGPIPLGLIVLHSCDNPSCVNPQHLRAGTMSENMYDKSKRKRCPVGIKAARSKLSAEQVAELRGGLTVHQACEKFGIGKSAYYSIRSGQSYPDVSA